MSCLNASSFIEKKEELDGSIDEIACVIGECLDKSFIDGFVDYLDKSTADNAMYLARALKIRFEDYINVRANGKPSLADEVGVGGNE